jgi:hypothetical protein
MESAPSFCWFARSPIINIQNPTPNHAPLAAMTLLAQTG